MTPLVARLGAVVALTVAVTVTSAYEKAVVTPGWRAAGARA